MILPPGTGVGPYRLGRLLGRGGMAMVYEATQESVGREVALKVVAPELLDPGFVERFRAEGRMQAALDHPHAVTVYEAGTSEHGPYLAMQLVRGTTLAALIDDGALTSARALHLLAQVADALDAAHAAGLVHRDVKPRNVLVDADHAYLADFGLTRSGDAPSATAVGTFMATIAYVAPEVVFGERAGPAADRYALAAVLFECLTGSPPFPRPTQAAVLFAHANEPPPRVSGRREGVPAALDEVLIAGLAKDPAQRPARAADLIASAKAALGDVELDPPVPGVPGAEDDGTTSGHVVRASPVAGGRRPGLGARGLAVVAAAVLAGFVLGTVVQRGADGTQPSDPPLEPPPAGTRALGADLGTGGRTVDCRGRAVTPASPACTVFQDKLVGATLVVPDDGVVRRWAVRSAVGEMALTVMRRRDEGYFQVGRSRTEFVNDGDPEAFAVDLPVERGDRLGLVVLDGAGVGVRSSEAGRLGRFLPPLGPIQEPVAEARGGLLLRVDYAPRARQRLPRQLTGAALARAPAGRVLARARVPEAQAEVRVVAVDGRGALDVLQGDRPVLRVGVPDLRLPLAPGSLQFDAGVSSPGFLGINLAFSRPDSARITRHYYDYDVRGRRLATFN